MARAEGSCPSSQAVGDGCGESQVVLQLVNLDGRAVIRGVDGVARLRLPLGFALRSTVAYAWSEGPNPVPGATPARQPLSRTPPLNGTVELSWRDRPLGILVGAALRWQTLQDRLAPAGHLRSEDPRGRHPRLRRRRSARGLPLAAICARQPRARKCRRHALPDPRLRRERARPQPQGPSRVRVLSPRPPLAHDDRATSSTRAPRRTSVRRGQRRDRDGRLTGRGRAGAAVGLRRRPLSRALDRRGVDGARGARRRDAPRVSPQRRGVAGAQPQPARGDPRPRAPAARGLGQQLAPHPAAHRRVRRGARARRRGRVRERRLHGRRQGHS